MEMEMERNRKRKRKRKMKMMDTEKNRGSSIMDYDLKVLLPPEIITEILYRLPADSAIGCRCICKQWRSLIGHPSFRDAHTCQVISSSPSSNPKKFGNNRISNSSTGFFLCAQVVRKSFKLEVIEYNDGGGVLSFKPSKPIVNPFPFLYQTWGSRKISSCNGLVFMGSDKPNINTLVCNPFTRQYVQLRIPTPLLLLEREYGYGYLPSSTNEYKGYMTYGFGYLPSTNEYKVVSIYYADDKVKNKGKVSVYTLGSGKWRNKGETPYWIKNTPLYPGAFANGAIHWFTDNREIVSFDLADEEFRLVVPLPPHVVPSHQYAVKYGVFGGCLCVTSRDATKVESFQDIWVLTVRTTNNNKEEFSWNKKFSIPWKRRTDNAAPKVVTKNGKILLCRGSELDQVNLISYDPKTGKFVYGKRFPPLKWVKVIPYTKSFVSLKAFGEKDAKCF